MVEGYQVTTAPIYAPDRERVLERALQRHHDSDGPLPDRTIEAIYRELMSGSFSLELPLKIGYLGPPGTFSHGAAVSHFGSSVELVELPAIDSVFEEVAAGRVNYGVVPYENSVGGSVTDSLDSFRDHEVTIYAEAQVGSISHFLRTAHSVKLRRFTRVPGLLNAVGGCRTGCQESNASRVQAPLWRSRPLPPPLASLRWGPRSPESCMASTCFASGYRTRRTTSLAFS